MEADVNVLYYIIAPVSVVLISVVTALAVRKGI